VPRSRCPRRYRAHVQGFGERDDGVHDRRAVRALHIGDKALIDLERVDREAAEIAEGRVPGAEIIDGKIQAQLLQLAQLGDVALAIGHDRAFRQLKLESCLRPCPEFDRKPCTCMQQIGLIELQRRDVHAHPEAGSPSESQYRQCGRPRQHPLTEFDNLPGALGNGMKSPARSCRVPGASSAPAPQSSRPCRSGLDLRLVAQFELVGAQRLAQVFLELEVFHGARIHLLVVEAEAGPAVGLGRIHRRVGVAHQAVRILAILGVHGDADARE
jgi:hypothetical protein